LGSSFWVENDLQQAVFAIIDLMVVLLSFRVKGPSKNIDVSPNVERRAVRVA
jgi:hypothetical protein